jgi:hypothetical protein
MTRTEHLCRLISEPGVAGDTRKELQLLIDVLDPASYRKRLASILLHRGIEIVKRERQIGRYRDPN